MITLRYYQRDAVEAAWLALRRGAHPVIELPTASGKSLVIAELSRRVVEKGGRVLILTHVQELVEQNAAEFQKLTGIEPGILCAALERTDKHDDVLFASVQSLYGPAKRREICDFNLIIIDECDLVDDKESDAKFYPAAFAAFPDSQRLGLSATPFRMSGPVWGEGKWFSEKCYSISPLELVKEGFLAPLVGVNTRVTLDLQKLSVVAGEYDNKLIENQETESWLRSVAASVKSLAEGRRHIAVFCPSVAVAEEAAKIFSSEGMKAEYVVGNTEGRDDLLEKWKFGEFPVMTSVNILSVGFNFPELDCLVCIRPTKSLRLWIQLCGRGMRKAEGKSNCLLLDFSGNLEVHGGVCAGMEEAYSEKREGIERVSPAPGRRVAGGRKINKGKSIEDLDPMLASPKGIWLNVTDVSYVVIGSKSRPGKRLLMVNYTGETEGGVQLNASEFVCVEYSGFAREMAIKWFEKRGDMMLPFYTSADAARIRAFSLPCPRRVRVRKSGKYMNVVEEEF